MKAFDPNYKLLDEMYQDDYYPAFLVNKVKDELQKVIDLLADAFFMPRAAGDRPDVVPEGAVNFAFIGQFAETKRKISAWASS